MRWSLNCKRVFMNLILYSCPFHSTGWEWLLPNESDQYILCASLVGMFYRLCGESKPKWEQWIIMVVTDVHRQLIDSLEPCTWELACEAIVPKQNICNTLSLRSWKPSGDEGIQLCKIWLDHDGAPGDKNDDTFHWGTDVRDDARSRIRNGQVGAVSECFCIWWLSHYNNGIWELVGLHICCIRVFFEYNFCFGVYCVLDSSQDCGAWS